MLYEIIYGLIFLMSLGYSSISSKEWASLSESMDGYVSLPTDDVYAKDYVLWTATYDNVEPEAIVFCDSEKDVSRAVKFLSDRMESHGSRRIRNCRHCLSGCSTTDGVIIDVGSLKTLMITDEGTARVGPGVDLAMFTQWAYEKDVSIPHGDCASVCFGGFLLGGGFGLTSRTFGMASDWIKSMNVVLPDGKMVKADQNGEYSDLFWALRGGGQGNYGVVTEFEMMIPEKKQVNPGLYVELSWEYTDKAWHKISRIWNHYAEKDEYGDHFAMYLRIQPSDYITTDYKIGLHGFWTGEQVDGLLVIANMLYEVDMTPSEAKVDYVNFEGWIEASAHDRLRYSSHCASRFAFDKVPSEWFDVMNKYTTRLMNFEATEHENQMLKTFWENECSEHDPDGTCRRNYAAPTFFMFLAPAGGAISRRASDFTAFPHRDATYFWVGCMRYMADYPTAFETANTMMEEMSVEVEALFSESSFVSFPDPDLKDYHRRYYGDNYPRLQKVKAKYDPKNFFTGPQGVVARNNDAKAINLKETFMPNSPDDPPTRYDRHRVSNLQLQRGHEHSHALNAKGAVSEESSNGIKSFGINPGTLALIVSVIAILMVATFAVTRFAYKGKKVEGGLIGLKTEMGTSYNAIS